MRIRIPDAVVALDRRAATERFSDLRNLVVLYFAAAMIALEGIASVFMWRESGNSAWLVGAVLMPLLAALIVRFCNNLRRVREDWRTTGRWELEALRWADRNLRAFVIGVYLLVCAIAAARWMFRPDDDPLLALALLAIALRITFSERLAIHFALFLTIMFVVIRNPGAGFSSPTAPLWQTISIHGGLTLLALLLGWYFTRRFTAAFLKEWLPQRQRLEEESRMREELDLARTIQLSMLPREIPSVEGLSIAASSVPASEVGGDFYDFYSRNGRFAIVQADVAGHGVGSGIVLSGIRTALRLLSEDLETPRQMISRLQTLMRETRTERMLVTMCLLSVASDRRSAVVISAGHPPVLHWKCATGEVEILMLPSLPLGTSLEQPFRMAELFLERGDRILIHTDGAYETRDRKGGEIGIDGLAELFAQGGVDEQTPATVERLFAALESFRAGGVQEDDVTLIAVRIEPADGKDSLS